MYRNLHEPSTAPEARHILVGQSAPARHVLRMIERMSNCRWPALLLGETGTGKEVVARAIHSRDPQGPFVTIDCSSMVGPLMESELFGHVKGAFTGAAGSKTGLIEAAHGGTAFFDEIGELPLELQAKLLRVLQEKEFRPVGSLATRRSDFRIIAASNRDLAKEVEKGTFRRDLYFRLSVINVRLVPLRDRKEDIPALVNHFLARVGGNHTLTAEVMEALLSYGWPGNIRELENCVQHMAAMNSGPLLHAGDLPTNLRNHALQKKAQFHAVAASAPSAMPPPAYSAPPPGGPAPEAPPQDALLQGVIPLAELERRAILIALQHTKGDRAVAAHLLGIGRTTLYRKLKEYEIAGAAA